MLVSELKGKRIAVWGMGVEGKAVLEFLKNHLPQQFIVEIKDDKLPVDAEITIRSPGVCIYKPEIAEAQKNGVKFTSLINIFLSEMRLKNPKCKIIGVTGTKGKSTTASMLYFMLQKLGLKVGLGGNIGVTPLDFLKQDLDYVVLELSSFQVADLENRLDIAVVVNLSRAHVDWHGSYEKYVEDKLRILKFSDYKIVNFQDEFLKNLTDVGFYNKNDAFHVIGGKIFEAGEELNVPKLKVPGDHNLANVCASLSVLKKLGLDYNKALAYMGEFEGLPHRLELVYEKNGIRFINDSIATVPESVMAAIEAFKGENVALIVGGYDNKNMDYTKLNQAIENAEQIKAALCLPDTGVMVKTSKSVQMPGLREAVTEAVKRLGGNGVVLLSPAAPSYNSHENFIERGKDFSRIAREII